jgi:hypothetical protein
MNGKHHPLAALIAGSVALAGLAAVPMRATGPAPTATNEVQAAAPAGAFRFTDPDGKPLPFHSDEELLEFLRTADVKSEKHLSGGITFPTKLLLEKDGIRADAIFRDVNEERNTPVFGGGRGELFFRDSYIYEPAAYELDHMLGLDNVPPATLRKLHREKGSVQIWVEKARTDKTLKRDNILPPDPQQWNKQLQMMNVFDALIYNTDRNSGNLLVAPDWKLWLIDHTRAFRRLTSLPEGAEINQCERGMYQKLKSLDEAAVRERLKPYLSTFELDGLWKRRALILERLDKLIAEKGENRVLYTFVFKPEPTPPQPSK